VDLHTAPTSIELVESKCQTALRWSTMNRQYIRSRSDLPGVEAFDEEPLEISFVAQLNISDAIDSALPCVVEARASVGDGKSLKPTLL
jgi:hypothetical protein